MSKTLRDVMWGVLFLGTMICFGCGGSGSSNSDRATEELNKSYQSYIDGNYSQAIEHANSSIGYVATTDALLFRSFAEYARSDQAAVQSTLAEFNRLYPEHGGDDLLGAYYGSAGTGSCALILSGLQTALNQNYAGLGCDQYWEVVEQDDTFSKFRNSCPTQYATLQGMKSSCGTDLATDPDAGKKCKENVTKVVKNWWGLQLYTDHELTLGLYSVAWTVSMIVRLFDSSLIAKAVATVISVRATEAIKRDKGCGVVFNWTWANFNPTIGTTGLYLYWLSVQK